MKKDKFNNRFPTLKETYYSSTSLDLDDPETYCIIMPGEVLEQFHFVKDIINKLSLGPIPDDEIIATIWERACRDCIYCQRGKTRKA